MQQPYQLSHCGQNNVYGMSQMQHMQQMVENARRKPSREFTPNSPLEPIDPQSLRDMVERQQPQVSSHGLVYVMRPQSSGVAGSAPSQQQHQRMNSTNVVNMQQYMANSTAPQQQQWPAASPGRAPMHVVNSGGFRGSGDLSDSPSGPGTSSQGHHTPQQQPHASTSNLGSVPSSPHPSNMQHGGPGSATSASAAFAPGASPMASPATMAGQQGQSPYGVRPATPHQQQQHVHQQHMTQCSPATSGQHNLSAGHTPQPGVMQPQQQQQCNTPSPCAARARGGGPMSVGSVQQHPSPHQAAQPPQQHVVMQPGVHYVLQQQQLQQQQQQQQQQHGVRAAPRGYYYAPYGQPGTAAPPPGYGAQYYPTPGNDPPNSPRFNAVRAQMTSPPPGAGYIGAQQQGMGPYAHAQPRPPQHMPQQAAYAGANYAPMAAAAAQHQMKVQPTQPHGDVPLYSAATSNGPQQVNSAYRPLRHQAPGAMSTYFGHDVPPPDQNLCLIGCVFVFAGYETCSDLNQWKTAVALLGGQVEDAYSSRCTHIVAETTRHPIVLMGLRESKRCVSLLWLADCAASRKMLPPWKAAHLPSLYEHSQRPAVGKLIALSGFNASERRCMRHMLNAVGAHYTPYLSKHNHYLIAKWADLGRPRRAAEWRIPVVNWRWLHDLCVGYAQLLEPQATCSAQYVVQSRLHGADGTVAEMKAFDETRCELSMDGSQLERLSEAHLLLFGAWRHPINVNQASWHAAVQRREICLQDVDSWHPLKRRAQTPPNVGAKSEGDLKRAKVEMNDVKEQNSHPAQSSETSSTPRIAISGVRKPGALNSSLDALKWDRVDTVQACTHLIVNAQCLRRCEKLLMAVAMGKWVLDESWLSRCAEEGRELDPWDFIARDAEREREYGFNMSLSILRAKRERLLENVCIYITPSVRPCSASLRRLARAAGALVLPRMPTCAAAADMSAAGVPLVLVGCHEDVHLCGELMARGVAAHTSEWLLSGVLRQSLDYDQFKLRHNGLALAKAIANGAANAGAQPQQQAIASQAAAAQVRPVVQHHVQPQHQHQV